MPPVSRPSFGGSHVARAWFVLGCWVALATQGSVAVESAARRSYNLPADEATLALKLFSQQSGSGIIAGTDVVKGIRTKAVRGELTASEALNRMLDGTGLVSSEDRKSGTFAVRKATDAKKKGQLTASGHPIVRPTPSSLKIP